MTASGTTAIRKRTLSWMALTVIITNIGLLSVVIIAMYFFGSFASALAYLGGDRLIADNYTRSVGTIRVGEQHAAFFKLSNMSNQSVKILGAQSSCTCLVTDQLPVALPPHGVFQLRVLVRPKPRSGQLSESVSLITDREDQQRLDLKISGRIVESNRPSTARPAVSK